MRIMFDQIENINEGIEIIIFFKDTESLESRTITTTKNLLEGFLLLC